jgi:hypothetical protein
MKYGGLGVLALLLIIAIALGISREHAPISKVCKVTYNDNTVATYECRYVDVQKNYIVVSTKDGDVNIPMSCVKMFTTTKEGGAK